MIIIINHSEINQSPVSAIPEHDPGPNFGSPHFLIPAIFVVIFYELINVYKHKLRGSERQKQDRK